MPRLRPRAPRRFHERGAGIDTQALGYLHILLTRRGPDLKRDARRHSAVAAALDHAHMQERITAAGKLYEAKILCRDYTT